MVTETLNAGKVFGPANAALDRMRRAAKRGTGCKLTAEMIQSLALTSLGQLWDDAELRAEGATK